MQIIHDWARPRQPYQHLLPFSFRYPQTVAGRFVASRFRIDPRLADTLAALAGIGGAR